MHYLAQQTLRRWPVLLFAAGLATAGYLYYAHGLIPGAAILRDADRTVAFRVGSRPLRESPVPHINGYPILKEEPPRGKDFTRSLTMVLLGKGINRKTTKCGVEPRVAYRIWSGQRAVDVLICFKCNSLWSRVVGEPLDESPESEWRTFDHAVAEELFRLSQEAFPNDRDFEN